MSPEKRKLAVQGVRAAEPLLEEQSTEKPYTLEEFSYQFFRCPLPPPKTARMGGGSAVGTRRGRPRPLRKARWAEKALAQALTVILSLAGRQTRRPSAGPPCLWPATEATCGPTPQSSCASHCSKVSTTTPDFGMPPVRSSLISFPPAYPRGRQDYGLTHLGPRQAPCRVNTQQGLFEA